MTDAVKNEALRISLEWGPRRNTPFEQRLKEARPELSAEDIAALRLLTNQVESEAWRTVVTFFQANAMNETAANAAWSTSLRAKWPWLDSHAFGSLWSQGCYYAWKDGELL